MRILFLLTISIVVISQSIAQTLPVEQLNELTTSIESQVQGIRHIKDVNGVLHKFTGTWKGSFDGKEIEIFIKKVTDDVSENVQHYHSELLLWDRLIMRYKLTDQNGTVLKDILDLPDDSPYVMPKYKYNDLETYSFLYYGPNAKCGDRGYAYLFYQNSTTMHLVYFYKGTSLGDCTSTAPPSLPINDQPIILTKQ